MGRGGEEYYYKKEGKRVLIGNTQKIIGNTQNLLSAEKKSEREEKLDALGY